MIFPKIHHDSRAENRIWSLFTQMIGFPWHHWKARTSITAAQLRLLHGPPVTEAQLRLLHGPPVREAQLRLLHGPPVREAQLRLFHGPPVREAQLDDPII